MNTDENPEQSASKLPFERSISPGRGKDTVKKAPATPAEVRALLFMVLDQHTSEMMVRSLRKKIAKANLGAIEFVFDRLVGRPAVNVHHDLDGALAQFMAAWSELANVEQTALPAPDYAGLTIEASDVSSDDAEDDNEPDSAIEDADSGDIIPIV